MSNQHVKTMTEAAELDRAYYGSYYTIAGAGGDLDEWVEGITAMLEERGIGTPREFFTTTGAAVNLFAGGDELVDADDQFPLDLTFLMFSLDGLDCGRLAIFKLLAGDRWFDDVIDNMRRG